MTDQELVRALKSGSQEAFQVFYDRYFDAIYKFCFFRLGQNHANTEDVVGEVMLTAVRKVNDLHEADDTKVFNWLAQIARFKLMEAYRRLKRLDQEKLFSSFDEEVAGFLEGNLAAEEEAPLTEEEDGTAEMIGAVLTSLPEDYQRVLSEKYLQGRSVKNIALHMDRSEKSVESLLTRSRDAFRKAHRKLQQSNAAGSAT